MSDVKQKVRIELLNEATGQPIIEVDAITSSEVIQYTNPTPIMTDIGSIEKGTNFNRTPISEIFDGLLYPYSKPNVIDIKVVNTDFPNPITENVVVHKERGNPVFPFTYTATIECGSSKTITATLKIYRDDGSIHQESKQYNDLVTGNGYDLTFDIPKFNITSTIELNIFDGSTTVYSPIVKYIYTDPIFIGFVPDTLLEDGELLDKNITPIKDYFNEIVYNQGLYIERRLLSKSNQISFVTNLDYDDKRFMNPCIMVPSYWGNALGILDNNQLNITNSYSVMRLDINIRQDEVVNYLLYVSRNTFDTNSHFLEGTKYYWDKTNDLIFPELSDFSKGIPLTSEFEVLDNFPLDHRFVVKTYEELIMKVNYPYDGLLTFVRDIDTLFRYSKGHWKPTATKLHVVETSEELTNNFGGWDDVAIAVDNGSIYRKRYNDVWELWGTIGAGGSGGGVCECQQWRFNEIYDPLQPYVNNKRYVDLVYHEGSTYFCKQSCVGVIPTDDKVYWAVFSKGSTGPDARFKLRFVSPDGTILSEEDVDLQNKSTGEIIPMEEVGLEEKGGTI